MKYTAPVVQGKGRGKIVVGFPTFNLKVPKKFTAKEGVYGAKVWLAKKEYRGALHFGASPTFDDTDKVLEIFVLNYDSDATVDELTFQLGPYLRPIATFLSPTELRKQIALDVHRVRTSKF